MQPPRATRWSFLCLVLLLSGAAGLIYEIVWFQLLHLTIGSGSRSVGVLLACYMGGLFLGSLACGSLIRRTRNPVRVYAALEFGIGVFALLLPHILMSVRSTYLAMADSPTITLLLQSLMSAALLIPPTMAMGATLPILARGVRHDESAGQRLGWLYAANLVGAVLGVFLAVRFLLPWLGLLGTNLLAVGTNLLAALLAFGASRSFAAEEVTDAAEFPVSAQPSDLPVLLVFALNGLVSLSFQVIAWRLYSLLLGATTYAFGLMLCVFLAGLGVGSAIGSWLARRSRNPRSVLIDVQLATAALIGMTAIVVPGVTGWLYGQSILPFEGLSQSAIHDLLQVAAGVFPVAVGWGMTFPLAIASLHRRHLDPARSIGRLYAFNTMGAVAGSLLASFVVIPYFGSSVAAVQLVWLPLVAALLLILPSSMPRWLMLVGTLVAVAMAYSPIPIHLHYMIRQWPTALDNPLYYYVATAIPLFLGFELFLVRRVPRRLIWGAVLSGVLVATSMSIPADVYEKGHAYSGQGLFGIRESPVEFLAEGATSAVVVRRTEQNWLGLQVGGYTCATTNPPDLRHLRFLGHLPAFFSADPSDVFIVGMGAGVSGGSVALHDGVHRVRVAEIEPRVIQAAACFADANHHILSNPKLSITVDDGRHALATSHRRFGVISTDPIAPFWMGSASLYSTEYYRLCRAHLADGGIFMQWIGLDGISESVMKSLMASFQEVFPDGLVWFPHGEILLMGSTGPIRIDVAKLRDDWNRHPAVAESFAHVGVPDVETMLSYYVCSLSTLERYLAGVVPVRDDNLLSQYVGWKSFSGSVSAASILELLAYRQDSDDVFLVPADERESFQTRLRVEWSKPGRMD